MEFRLELESIFMKKLKKLQSKGKKRRFINQKLKRLKQLRNNYKKREKKVSKNEQKNKNNENKLCKKIKNK